MKRSAQLFFSFFCVCAMMTSASAPVPVNALTEAPITHEDQNSEEISPETNPFEQVEYTKDHPYIDDNAFMPEYLDDIGAKIVVIDSRANAAGTWQQDAATGKWWFRYPDGSYPVNTWVMIQDKWYHFDTSGWMQTGWIQVGSTYYYLDTSGAMKTGWFYQANVWYYLNPSTGAMTTGWQKINGEDYYFNTVNGAMVTGWAKLGGNWYYFGTYGGLAREQWIQEGSTYYWIDSRGIWEEDRDNYTASICKYGYFDFSCHSFTKAAKNLRYKLDDSLKDFTSTTNINTNVKKGFNRWNNGSSLVSIKETSLLSEDILVTAGNVDNKHAYAATQFRVKKNGTVMNPDLANWGYTEICYNMEGPTKLLRLSDIENIATHEIGHALGLDHSIRTDSVVYPFYIEIGTGTIKELSDRDIKTIEHLYGQK